MQSLAHCHDLLVEHDWEGAELQKLIQSQLTPFGALGGSRFTAVGPSVLLKPQAVQLLGLALHELATNAAKHGALTTPNGSVLIEWAPDQSEHIKLVWREQGGPKVQQPTRKGFGHTVLARMSASLDSEAHLDFPPDGIVWQIVLHSSHFVLLPNKTDV